jgi:hypothetical protein
MLGHPAAALDLVAVDGARPIGRIPTASAHFGNRPREIHRSRPRRKRIPLRQALSSLRTVRIGGSLKRKEPGARATGSLGRRGGDTRFPERQFRDPPR